MPKLPSFPGFTALSEQIFVREGGHTDNKLQQPNHPRVIIIFAWGDALPKHVTKYIDRFQSCFPHAKQIIVLSPIYQTLLRNVDKRMEAMKPILHAAFGPTSGETHEGSVVMHVMSNTGGIAYGSFLRAYEAAYGNPCPHQLVTFDSTPGSANITLASVSRLALAMAMGTASWFPWPFVVTQWIWGAFLLFMTTIEKVLGRESAAAQSVKAVTDPKFQSLHANQLYLYGKEDPIILWSEIEEHIAEARRMGYETETHLFVGSGHVEHMRKHPEEYWGIIEQAWARSATKSNTQARSK